MVGMGLLTFGVFLLVLLLLARPLGSYMAAVFTGKQTFLDPVLDPVERLIYRTAGIDPRREMNWREYSAALIAFSLLGILLVYVIQRLQGILPLNPGRFAGVERWLAFNTAVSFVTNTNWQAYAGETTMSRFTQMVALASQNFLSAAAGVAVAIALIRGLTRRTAKSIGNFWSDLTRATLRVFLPLSLVFALLLVSQGVIQSLGPDLTATTLEGQRQTLPMGPVASQEAIKELGTNGGGFFNANSAHPFENPSPLTNFLEILAILLVPAALVFTYGRMAGDSRQGYVILAAMLGLFVIFLTAHFGLEQAGNPQLGRLGVSAPTAMEGKEVRFGIASSSLFATATTAASCGAVNNMHDSQTPAAGLIDMLQIMVGEVVFGGVGSGLYGMLIFVVLTIFIVGLMVGRTPEYLGKKIEPYEMKMATLAVLIPAGTILLGSAIGVASREGLASILNPGPHGLSEILYAFTSAAGNNGSAFAGLNANTPFYNILLALAMLIGRFGVIVPVLAIAGSMASKIPVSPGPGTFRTTGPLFGGLLAGVVVIVGALTFFPALALGPLVEQLLMAVSQSF